MCRKCRAEHTETQPSEALWRCPKCLVNSAFFVVEEIPPGADEACGLVHVRDVLKCHMCGGSWSGSDFVRAMEDMARVGGFVLCPHCRGSGDANLGAVGRLAVCKWCKGKGYTKPGKPMEVGHG